MPRRPLSFTNTNRGVDYAKLRVETRRAEQQGKFVEKDFNVEWQIFDRDVQDALKMMRTNFKKDWDAKKMDILHNAAEPMVAAVKPQIPIYKGGVHYRYFTKKTTNKKTGQSSEKEYRASFIPGHLRKSVKVLNPFKPRLKRIETIVIGTLKNYPTKVSRGPFDGVNKADAYYTNFLYGSAVAFQTKVLLQGFLKSFHASRDVVIKGTHSLINQNAKAAGLSYRIQ